MLEKAKIIPYDDEGKIERTKVVYVMFNPSEYSVTSAVTYVGEEGNKQFRISETPEFKVSLFYDTYEWHSDVREETKKIISLMGPTTVLKSAKHPPICVFVWGKFLYQGVITNAEQKFLMFMENGVPVRATLDVTFKEQKSEKELEHDKGLEACRKLWMVKSGDRLDLIANKALKDPLQWRKIAEANQIDNPINFPGLKDIGRTLVIPD